MSKQTTVREFKALPQFVKAEGERTFTGVFSVFGVLDSYGDIIHPGAFTKTFQERGGQIFHLWQHSFGQPAIATIDELREISRDELPAEVRALYPEATGGAQVRRTYLDTPRANEVLVGLHAKVPYQMSFAFDAVKYDFEEDTENRTYWGEIRHLREVRLYETSDVLWGANDATRADSQKTPLDLAFEHLKALLDGARRGRKLHPNMHDQLAALVAELRDSDRGDPPAEPQPSGPALTDLRQKLNSFLLTTLEG